MRLGTWEILFILGVVLLVFGPGRIVKLAGEMGKGIKAFKDGLNDEKSEAGEGESKDKTE